MRPWVLLSACLFSASVGCAKSYPVDGIVVAVNRSSNTMVVSHRPIARYMDAMTMPFHVGNAGELDGLYPGARVQFDLEVSKEGSVARNVRKSGGGDPPIVTQNAALKPGEAVPDFQLMDQQGRTVHLADFRGEVVAIDFIYTRCPLPDVCPRLSANFAAIQRRFSKDLGSSLVLLSVTVDPDYDTPAVLSEYARRWNADAKGWLFLTGDVAPAATRLGEVYWADEGSIGHNSVISIIGRGGKLAARVDGSTWRIDQLASLISHELENTP